MAAAEEMLSESMLPGRCRWRRHWTADILSACRPSTSAPVRGLSDLRDSAVQSPGTSASSSASLVKFTAQRSRINDREFGASANLFIDHRSSVVKPSVDRGSLGGYFRKYEPLAIDSSATVGTNAGFALADPQFAIDHRFNSASEARIWRFQNGLTWHYVEHGQALQLVLRSLDGVPNQGGRAVLRGQ